MLRNGYIEQLLNIKIVAKIFLEVNIKNLLWTGGDSNPGNKNVK